MKTEKKTGADRTQLAVRDEWFSDERVRSFLDSKPTEGENADYHVLLRAYRGMVPEAFERFIEFFKDDGRDINAKGPDNKTILSLISEHKKSTDYAAILKTAGAV